MDFSSSAVKGRMDSGSLPSLVPGGLTLKSECVGEAVSSGSEMTLELWLCVHG